MGYKLYLTEEQTRKLLAVLKYWNGECVEPDEEAKKIQSAIERQLNGQSSHDLPYISEWWPDDFK